MSMIKVENLTFAYPSGYDNVFENVSFQIDTDWKLGFVGRNGRGKTTFLKLLMGRYPYQGRITASTIFDYFPYKVSDENWMTYDALSEICPTAQQWEFERELSLLEAETDILWQPFDTLSKGQQTKAMLAALFLNSGHFLLIDEPTNHLDMKGRQTVAAYLKKKKGFILVSHDRNFLDGCVDHILSINRADIEVQSGNFSSWFENFQKNQTAEIVKNQRLQKDMERLKKAAERTDSWAGKVEASKYGNGPVDRGYIGHKSAKMMKRAKSIKSRQQKAAEEKSTLLKNIEKTEVLKISPLKYKTDRLASFEQVELNYGSRTVCGPLSFEIRYGDRLALDGKNGSGKSSILKLVAGRGDIPEYRGNISIGSNLAVSYVPQDASFLKGSLSEFAEAQNIDESLFKTILRKMDFERVQFEKNMEDFSEGQKKKVLLAGSLCQQAHLYIWDEPLNFIDIYSRRQIQQLIEDFSPTMIFVEHDEAFRDAIATGVVRL